MADEMEKALSDLVFYVEWHMPYKGEQHPTYSKPMLAAHAVLQKARKDRRAQNKPEGSQ